MARPNSVRICRSLALLATGVLFVGTASGSLTRLDVTAAVRAAGDLRSVTSSVAAREGYETVKLFDGAAADVGNGMFVDYAWSTALKEAYAAGGMEVVYEITDSFEAGKDVVIDGYSILTGATVGNAFSRLPGSWKFQAWDAAASVWVTLDERTAYAGWKTASDGLVYGTTTCVGGTFHFVNSRAFRKYRFLFIAPYWKTSGLWTEEEAETNNAGAFALSEIQLFGYVAEDIDGTLYDAAEVLDLTETVRTLGDSFRRLDTNLSQSDTKQAFNGNEDDRFFTLYDTVKTAYESGGAWVEYAFADEFASGADVVVSGYSISVSTKWADALLRLPCDWKFQGCDEATGEWVTLDEYRNFRFWETSLDDATSVTCLGYRFDFANPSAYRRYRLLVTRQYLHWAGKEPSPSLGAMQISEIRLFGLIGKGIAGTVGTERPQFPLRLAEWGQTRDALDNVLLSAVVSNSSTVASGERFTELFNTSRYGRVFRWLDEEGETGANPFDVYYEIPDDVFLSSKDVVLTNYVMELNEHWAGYVECVPRAWRLEGFADGRWILLDRREQGSVTWTEVPFSWSSASDPSLDGDYIAYTAVCEIAPKKRFAASRYRLRVTQTGVYRERPVFTLSELTFNGVWGVGIANPPPKRTGLAVVVK